jgi:hypothetical protein
MPTLVDDSGRQPWIRTAILAGVLYVAAGLVLPSLAGAAAFNQTLQFWRWSAFIISGVVLAAHIAHEHFQLHNATRTTAWHAAVGAALGGFGFALAGNIHGLGLASGYRPKMLIALVTWPLLTGVPAFLVAVVIAAVLSMKRNSASSRAL